MNKFVGYLERNATAIIVFILLFLSVVFIFLLKPPENRNDWILILKNIGFNLLGAVIAFLIFQVIFEGINKLGEQRGVKIDSLNKNDFIKKVIKSKNTVRIMET